MTGEEEALLVHPEVGRGVAEAGEGVEAEAAGRVSRLHLSLAHGLDAGLALGQEREAPAFGAEQGRGEGADVQVGRLADVEGRARRPGLAALDGAAPHGPAVLEHEPLVYRILPVVDAGDVHGGWHSGVVQGHVGGEALAPAAVADLEGQHVFASPFCAEDDAAGLAVAKGEGVPQLFAWREADGSQRGRAGSRRGTGEGQEDGEQGDAHGRSPKIQELIAETLGAPASLPATYSVSSLKEKKELVGRQGCRRSQGPY